MRPNPDSALRPNVGDVMHVTQLTHEDRLNRATDFVRWNDGWMSCIDGWHGQRVHTVYQCFRVCDTGDATYTVQGLRRSGTEFTLIDRQGARL